MLNIELDILTYLKTTQTIYLLNFILLENYQSTCLKFISKPLISLANKMVFNKIKNFENLTRILKNLKKFLIFIKKNNKNNINNTISYPIRNGNEIKYL